MFLPPVGVDQGVGARILARNVGLRAVHPDPLVRVGPGLVSPLASTMPVVTAVSVWPTCAVPVMVGAPVAAVLVECGGGVVAVGGVGGAHGVDGGDAVVAGGGGVEPHVGVGGVGALGVSVEIGPATAVGGDLDLVAGDGGAAGVDRGGPGEVDPGRPVGGRGQPGGRAGRGEER